MNARRQDDKKRAKPKDAALDATTNDFEEEHFIFRYPKHSYPENAVNKSVRGRPKKASNRERDALTSSKSSHITSFQLSRGIVSNNTAILESSEDPSFLKSTSTKPTSTSKQPIIPLVNDESNTLTDVEKSTIQVGSEEEEEEDDDLTELEKSVCSSSEKLCPSCKHIVSLDEYSDHFSKCLQKFSFIKSQRKIRKRNGPKTLPCPICFKPLTSDIDRRSHIRTCGSSHGLSTEQLISASRLQEKQVEERVALGLPVLQLLQKDNESKKKRSNLPKTATDPDLELAFALSRSLAEEEKKKREKKEDKLLSLGLHGVIQEERRKLVLPQPPPIPLTGKGSRKEKKKKVTRTTLMTRTKEERERIITEKVAAVLVNEVNVVILPTTGKPHLQRCPGPLDRYQDRKSSLWNFASTGVDLPVESHFTPELNEFVKPKNIPVGELLKSLSQVPGRLNYTAMIEDSGDEEKPEEGEVVETTIVDQYCTQLALAEMLGTQEMHELSYDGEDEDEGVKNREGDGDDSGEKVCSDRTNEPAREIEAINTNEKEGQTLEKNDDDSNIPCIDLASDDLPMTETLSASPFQDLEKSKERSNTTVDRIPTHSPIKANLQTSHHVSSFEPSLDSRLLNTPPPPSSPILKSSSTSTPLNTPSRTSLHSKFVYDWSCLLANGDHSDVILFTAEGEIPVHFLVLSVRCPRMIKEIEEDALCSESGEDFPDSSLHRPSSGTFRKWIDWSSVTYESAYAFMVYLYSGVCTINSKENNVWLGLFDLSIKYNCAELVTYLERVYETSSTEKDSANIDQFNNCERVHQNASNELILTPNSKKSKTSSASLFKGRKESKSSFLSSPLQSPKGTSFTREKSEILYLDTESCHDSSNEDEIQKRITSRIVSPDSDGKNICNSGQSMSPDIFGDWDDNENSKNVIETPSVTPPRVQIGASVVKSVKTSDLNETLENNLKPFNTTGEVSDTRTQDESVLIISQTKHDNDKCENELQTPKTVLRRNLCYEFKEHSLKEKTECDSILLPSEKREKTRSLSSDDSEQLNLCQSPLSDISYPSGNQVVDLTLASGSSSDSLGKTSVPPCEKPKENDLECDSPQKCSKNISSCLEGKRSGRGGVDTRNKNTQDTSPEIQRNNDYDSSICKPSFLFSKMDDDFSPSENLSSLFENAIIGDRGRDFGEPKQMADDPRLNLSPTKFLNEMEDTLGHSTLKEFSPLNEKENHVRNKRDSLFMSPQNKFKKRLKTVRSKESNLVLNSTGTRSFGNFSDESLLKAVREVEEKFNYSRLKDTSNINNKKGKLYKSKSCTDCDTSHSFVTPNKREREVRLLPNMKKSFHVTPLPDYKSMLSPDIQKELNKYGIRKLSRKKAITLLLHIYDQMHPLVTDSETEANYVDTPRKNTSTTPSTKPEPKQRKKKPAKKAAKIKALEDEENLSEDVLNSSQTTITSVDSDFECLEETAFPEPQDDDVITPTQQMSLETRLMTFIRSDTELHRKILLYEPIWANKLHQSLKSSGIKCNMSKLIEFLDEQCITFRLPTRERTRKRPRKNSSPGKSPKKKVSKR